MVSTTEEVTAYSTSLRITQTTVKEKVLRNHCVYSPTYFILKREQQNVMLELQNKNSEPLKLVISCVPIKQNK